MGNTYNHEKNFSKKKRKILFLGMEKSGKSSVVKQIIGEKFTSEYTETLDLEIHDTKYAVDSTQYELVLYDYSGNKRQRIFWRQNYVGAQAIVFVIDVVNRNNEELIAQYQQLLVEKTLQQALIAVFLNKEDIVIDAEENGYKREEFIQELEQISNVSGEPEKKMLLQRSFAYSGHTTVNQWESFKKQYHKKEFEIKNTLQMLQQSAMNYAQRVARYDSERDFDNFTKILEVQNGVESPKKNDTNSVPCNGTRRESHKYNGEEELALFKSLEEKLKSQINEMTDFLNEIKISEEEQQHTQKSNMLRRFKEIHLDHIKELKKLNSQIDENKLKYELLKESRNVTTQNSAKPRQLDTETKKLLRDNQQLSDQIAKSQAIISAAAQIKGSLYNQKDKLSGVGQLMPGINHLTKKIRMAEWRNQIIIALVVTICTVLLIYRAFFA